MKAITRTIELFGKEIEAKAYSCRAEDGPEEYKERPVKLILTICPVAACNASCAFCVAAADKSSARIDTGKLRKVLTYLKERDVILSVNVSGGEPFTDTGLLNETVNIIYGVFGDDITLSMNTNGSRLDRLKDIEKFEQFEALHISRHHYDDAVNDRLFGTEMPTTEQLKEAIAAVSFKDVFIFNCLLLKEGIGDAQSARKFLEYAHAIKVPKVGFISTMAVNEYTREQQVRYTDVIGNPDGRMLVTRGFADYDRCRCTDGVYACDDGGIIQFYGRETSPGTGSYVRGLVYGADNVLRTGYGESAVVLWDGD